MNSKTTKNKRDKATFTFSYNMAARITKKFDSKAKTGNLSDYNSLMTTLELMTTLTNITKQITTSFSHLRDAEMQKAAQNMLVYYLGIINVAFGKNTTGAWKQVLHKMD